ncbi:hypothetical protein, partial [Trueperella pyogenes]|uniref:hypothetical protein n=1 Tax=Trueperella pyogenes TaxID=1661 RepID=UPI0019D6D2DC
EHQIPAPNNNDLIPTHNKIGTQGGRHFNRASRDLAASAGEILQGQGWPVGQILTTRRPKQRFLSIRPA